MVDKIRIADVVNNYEFTPPPSTHTQINNENSVIFFYFDFILINRCSWCSVGQERRTRNKPQLKVPPPFPEVLNQTQIYH